jgi:hypothetical protein
MILFSNSDSRRSNAYLQNHTPTPSDGALQVAGAAVEASRSGTICMIKRRGKKQEGDA